ncbi:hypothetical protein V494_05704 [Pseudogymnoascus sp. VKM F-4513 (FW-928)]|nr:hypothetical protein V494_05704 [Pseudogymnoascus sp. VKM F-4513 (FW-928)]
MHLLLLPTEILLQIGRHTTTFQTLSALACVNRHFHEIFDPLLYQLDAGCPYSCAINWASTHGKIGIIEKSLSHGAEVPLTPIYSSAAVGKSGFIDGRDIQDLIRGRPSHPLCLAVQNGHEDIAEFFIARGCDVDMTDTDCFSLLCLAVTNGHMRMVKTLLGAGARQDDRSISSRSKTIEIAASRGDEAMVEVLLHYGSESTYPNARQMHEAFRSAAEQGHYHIFKPLLNSSIIDLDFRLRDSDKRAFETPLLWAVEEGDLELVKLCLARGADPNANTGNRDPALARAVVTGDEEMVRVLIGGTDRRRRTQALTRSMDYPDGRMARILLDSGTVAEFQNGDDSATYDPFDGRRVDLNDVLVPPLIRAVTLGHFSLVQLLVARGADVNVDYTQHDEVQLNRVVRGPLQLAIEMGNEEIANFLSGSHSKEEELYQS